MTDAESTNMSYCRECGERIKENAEMCPECGVRQKSPPNSREKSTGVAVVASFLFVGLGQIYNGQVLKGVGLIFLQFFNIAVLYVAFFFELRPVFGVWQSCPSGVCL